MEPTAFNTRILDLVEQKKVKVEFSAPIFGGGGEVIQDEEEGPPF